MFVDESSLPDLLYKCITQNISEVLKLTKLCMGVLVYIIIIIILLKTDNRHNYIMLYAL